MINVEFEWICYRYDTSRQSHSVFDDIGQYINYNETPFMSLNMNIRSFKNLVVAKHWNPTFTIVELFGGFLAVSWFADIRLRKHHSSTTVHKYFKLKQT